MGIGASVERPRVPLATGVGRDVVVVRVLGALDGAGRGQHVRVRAASVPAGALGYGHVADRPVRWYGVICLPRVRVARQIAARVVEKRFRYNT